MAINSTTATTTEIEENCVGAKDCTTVFVAGENIKFVDLPGGGPNGEDAVQIIAEDEAQILYEFGAGLHVKENEDGSRTITNTCCEENGLGTEGCIYPKNPADGDVHYNGGDSGWFERWDGSDWIRFCPSQGSEYEVVSIEAGSEGVVRTLRVNSCDIETNNAPSVTDLTLLGIVSITDNGDGTATLLFTNETTKQVYCVSSDIAATGAPSGNPDGLPFYVQQGTGSNPDILWYWDDGSWTALPVVAGEKGDKGDDGAPGEDGEDGTDFSTVPDATAAQITNILDNGGLFGCTSTGVIRKIPTSALDSAPAGANGAQYGAPVCLPGINYATSDGSSDNTFSYIDWVMPAGAKFLIATDGENNGSQVVYDVAEGEVVTVKLRFDTNNQNGYQSAFITDIDGSSPASRETDCSPNLGVHLVPDLNDPNFNSLKPIINPNASDVTFTNLPGTGGGNPPFNYTSDFYVFC